MARNDLVCVFRRLTNLLKARHPQLHISVRRVSNLINLHGDCCRNPRPPDRPHQAAFIVRICKQDNWRLQLESLIHEIAHAATYTEWELLQDHGPLWGQEYAECYKIYETLISAQG